MQDPASSFKNRSPASSLIPNAGMPESASPSTEETPAVAKPPVSHEPEASKFDQSMASLKETLEEHKGKLAIGAAATLGLMVYYKWREKQLAEEEPQEYERLRRIKESVRHADERGDAGEKTGKK